MTQARSLPRACLAFGGSTASGSALAGPGVQPLTFLTRNEYLDWLAHNPDNRWGGSAGNRCLA